MIVFDLSCSDGHTFEGWFGSSADFVSQQERGLLTCPQCGCAEVSKAPMAPAVGRKGNSVPARPSPVATAEPARQMANAPMPPEVAAALSKLAEAQAQALKNSTWVGGKFAEQSRAMHYGEREQAAIHGQATLAEAKALAEEGVAIAPLPFPVAPPDELN